MTMQSPLLAGEWFNFRHLQEVAILSHTSNTVRLRYDDAAEDIVKLLNTAQLKSAHELLETLKHPAPPESGPRKAGSWVNLRGVTAARVEDGSSADERVVYLTYEDGVADDAVVMSAEQAQEVASKV